MLYCSYKREKEIKKMMYDIYPCDLDPFGECPKHCQDCAHCVGWFMDEPEDEEN